MVLTADHGESLGEHNRYFSHSENIYLEVLRIPLIIRDNRYFKGGKIIKKTASAIDIVPTILSRINFIFYFFNKTNFEGIDLRKLGRDKDVVRNYIYCYAPWAWSILDVIKKTRYILYKDGKEELYILPDENNNLINNDSAKIATLKEKLKGDLRKWLLKYPIPSDIHAVIVNLNKETEDSLRSLGYIQ